jgi:prolyl-tRNA synthetase
MKVTVLNEQGKAITPIMGCYGIGVTRVLASAIEQNNDKDGIIWPASIAPYDLYLCFIGKTPETKELIESIHNEFKNAGLEVLFDDRDVPAGEKFGDSDLMGMPYRVVVSGKSLAAGGVEVKRRTENDGSVMSAEALLELLA